MLSLIIKAMQIHNQGNTFHICHIRPIQRLIQSLEHNLIGKN